MAFVKKHQIKLIIVTICLFLVILASIAIYKIFYPNQNSIYGNRLDNIVVVSNDALENIKTEIINTNKVESVSYNVNARIVKFFIVVKDKISVDSAQKIADIVTGNLDQAILTDYDIEVFISKASDEKFPIIGYHHKSSLVFSWNNNEVGGINEE